MSEVAACTPNRKDPNGNSCAIDDKANDSPMPYEQHRNI
jgi:hypothetical protein